MYDKKSVEEAYSLYHQIDVDERRLASLCANYDRVAVVVNLVGYGPPVRGGYSQEQKTTLLSAEEQRVKMHLGDGAVERSLGGEVAHAALEHMRRTLRRRVAESRRRLAQLGYKSTP